MNKKGFLLAAVFTAVLILFPNITAQATTSVWSIGYWMPWGNGGSPALPVSDIQWDGLTHIIQYAALANTNGTLDLNSEQVVANAPSIISAAHAHGVKVLLNVTQGYWTGQTNNLQSAVTGNLSAFVSNIMNLVNTYGYDGVDIDWEPFDPGTNGPAMKSLATALRAQLGTKPLMAAAMAEPNHNVYWGSVQSLFDRINVMTYDLTGTWNPYSWYNAALYDQDGKVWSVDMAVSRYLSAGVPASKLGIGIPFYGWQWTSGGVTGPRQNWSSTPTLSQIYYSGKIAPMLSTHTYHWDAQAMVPYLSANDFVTYDNEQSIAEKVKYVLNKKLGGWIIWELSGDYFPGKTGDVKHPFISAIRDAMGSSPADTQAPTVPLGLAVVVVSSSQINLSWNPSTDNVGVAGYKVYRNGAQIAVGTLTSFQDTGLSPSTFYAYTVSAYDAAGNASAQSSAVSASTLPSQDVIPPTVSITSPANGSTVSGTVNITAAASDNIGVAKVEFYVDGALKAADIAAPYSYSWDTASLSGSRSIMAKAYDAANNSSSASVSVTVNNTNPNNPYANWKFDDGAGSVAADSSGNANNISLYNSPAWLSGTACKNAACLSFNGANQYGSASLDLSNTAAVTVTFWMNWPTYANDDKMAMEFSPNFNNAATGFLVDPNSAFYPNQFDVGVNGNAGYNQALFARPSAGWHHYAFVMDKSAPAATEVVPFVDGVPVAYTKPMSSENTNNFGNDKLFLMSRAGSSYFGVGSMDDVRVYKRALSVSEIQDLAAVTPPVSDTQAPTVPLGLAAAAVSSSQINLSWNLSSDNVAVTGYKVYRNGVQIASVTSASYQDVGLAPATTYSYTVSAYDAASNASVQSTAVLATTQSLQYIDATLKATPALGRPTLKVGLTATILGTATGPINYYFYCNRSDTGVNVTSGYNLKVSSTNVNPYTTSATLCTYKKSGAYMTKIIAQRGSLSAQAQAQVTVSRNISSIAAVVETEIFEPVITKTLIYKSHGTEVGALQGLLANDPEVYPEGLTTGYFGNITLDAVKKFQTKYRIASPGESGYGTVGPKTRAKLNSLLNSI